MPHNPISRLSILRSEKGMALIEFAFALPLLLIALLGIIGIADYLRATEKLEGSTMSMSDTVSQISPTTTAAEMASIMNAASLLMQPYSLPRSTTYIFTDVQVLPPMGASGGSGPSSSGGGPGSNASGGGCGGGCGTAEIVWQYSYSPGGVPAYVSKLGTPAAAAGEACPTAQLAQAAIPSPLTYQDFDEFIVGEAFYQYQPVLAQYMGTSAGTVTLYRSSLFFVRNLTNGASSQSTNGGPTTYTFGTLTTVPFNTALCNPQ